MQYFVYKNLENTPGVVMEYKKNLDYLIYLKSFMNIRFSFIILDGEIMKQQMLLH